MRVYAIGDLVEVNVRRFGTPKWEPAVVTNIDSKIAVDVEYVDEINENGLVMSGKTFPFPVAKVRPYIHGRIAMAMEARRARKD